MTLILDAGALIAYERGSQTVQAFLERAEHRGEAVRTTTAVVAQAWRGGARQARLTRLLSGLDEIALTGDRARAVGVLLARSRSSDVVDGSLVEAARDGDEILTGDRDDLLALAAAAGKTLIVTPVS